MQLPIVVGHSYSDIYWTANNILTREPSMAAFWLTELINETVGYQRSMNMIGQQKNCKDGNRLRCLLKSIDVELNTVLNLASAASLRAESGCSTEKQKNLETHLTRLDIKGRHLVSHLTDFFDSRQLEQLYKEFDGERATVSLRMRSLTGEGSVQ